MIPDDTSGGGEAVRPPDADPVADEDAGVAVDDDPAQVDLNSEQWDTE